ncbi:hypothetical protein C8R47DRAFT_1079353 [Mycena vitilis]|nr:hypothetical protein C8R47DRAFT_1079353 [Mycena vitilis]
MDDIVFASDERWTRNLFLPGLATDQWGRIICLANLANILHFYINGTSNLLTTNSQLGDSNTAGGLSWCTAALSVTMIARLMLNLHEAAAPPEGSTRTTNLESIRFAYSRTVPEDGLESGAEAGEEEI